MMSLIASSLNAKNQGAPVARNEILNVDVVYAISGMTLLAIEGSMVLSKIGRDCGDLLNAGWKIGCAWDALLAGDIEDIRTHLEYEAAAKNLH
jgi:hypothetical protein